MLVDLVQTVTRDGVRLDGAYQAPARLGMAGLAVAAVCLVHGTGGSFYSSTLFDALADRLLALGCGVLRINTRGHDLMSTAATSQGGRRQGAAYEVVDDCRHDLAAWKGWLREHVGPRVGLVGHSLGAVKCLYAVAQDPYPPPACVAALSPPRLSHAWFLAGPEGEAFLRTYQHARRLVEEGRPTALVEVDLPLPFVITAAGYVEKYGPDERYNYLNFVGNTPCPTLVTLGEVEVARNMAFRGTPEAVASLAGQNERLRVEIVAGADHFYTGVREALADRLETWLRAVPANA